MTGKSLVAMCSECKKIRIGNTWIGKENPSYILLSRRPRLSEGYCPECENIYHEKIKQRRERIVALGY